MGKKWKLLLPCYFAFLVNGAMVLLVGAILPYLIEEAKLNYSCAGGLLSAFAIGNLMASFINPVMVSKVGRKASTICGVILIPISLLSLTFIPSLWIMYLLFGFIGIGRGTVSIINNSVVNDNSNGKPVALNLLHMTFAIGAFLAPFLTTVYTGMGLNWRVIVYTLVVCSVMTVIGYSLMELDEKTSSKEKSENKVKFWLSPNFYINGLLLFFYLGLEGCVNGWFVTYFKSSNIMSDAYATNLVSITWIAVMIGRLLTAILSNKVSKKIIILIESVATAGFFTLLISTTNLVWITIAIIGLGFFFAGIYPTCVSNAGSTIKGYQLGTSMLLAIAALGGIIFPKIVGVIADVKGLTGAIGILSINAIMMVVLAVVNAIRKPEEIKKLDNNIA